MWVGVSDVMVRGPYLFVCLLAFADCIGWVLTESMVMGGKFTGCGFSSCAWGCYSWVLARLPFHKPGVVLIGYG